MTTILLINAISSLLAAVGIGGFLARENRRVRRSAAVQPIYVTTETTIRARPQCPLERGADTFVNHPSGARS